jgi:hypothetical protein
MNQITEELTEPNSLDNFINYSILEAQSFESKMKTKLQSLEKESQNSLEYAELLELKRQLQPAFDILESYDQLIKTLIISSEKNNPLFQEVFFKKDNKIDRDLYLNLYPQYMSVSHYAEIFNLCGHFPQIDIEKINQITIKRMYAYQKFQLINKEVAINDDEEYSLGELYTLVKAKKINEMLDGFWKAGRQTTLEYMVSEKGGRIVTDKDGIKVFEVKTSRVNNQGKPIYNLIYLTPSFYAYGDEVLFNQQKGKYFFLNSNPKKSTCLVETEEMFFRHDFKKTIGNSDNMRFKLKVSVPINMFKFEVVKNS